MDGAVDIDIGAYLARIGWSGEVSVDVATLEALQRAHLTAVPFENLDVVAGSAVRTDAAWSIDKIVNRRRGGWCFETNGAFASLLHALGFDVRILGAAVLLDGPSVTIDHLTLEVQLDTPFLVDVGFGDSFMQPLELNRAGPQDGGTGTFEFLNSPQGRTLTRHDDTGLPEPQYRFTRFTRQLADFEPASEHLRTDPTLRWSRKPFATRLLDGGPDRVTLLEDRLKVTRSRHVHETPVAACDWPAVLAEWFDLSAPEGSVPTR